MPREVARLGTPTFVVGGFDLHHVGTEIAEVHRGHGAGAVTGAIEHPNSRERRHGRILPDRRRAGRTAWGSMAVTERRGKHHEGAADDHGPPRTGGACGR